MALSSLFILMTEHGLEYPNFYEKLYALLVPSVFVAKHRARFLQVFRIQVMNELLIYNPSSFPLYLKRFLQLLDACLRSSLLPAYLAASFAKKLSRLSLSVPPSGSLVITALIYNQPSCASGIAFETVETANEANSEADEPNECRPKTNKNLGIDYFNNQESHLKKTGAMSKYFDFPSDVEAYPTIHAKNEVLIPRVLFCFLVRQLHKRTDDIHYLLTGSSLWGIDTLRHHYCPPVSRFVSSLETDLTVRAKTTEMKIEDFSSGSYATIFGDEVFSDLEKKVVHFHNFSVLSLSLFQNGDLRFGDHLLLLAMSFPTFYPEAVPPP
ncbi:hypothetical protein YC2023_081798 [Brassica napus]